MFREFGVESLSDILKTVGLRLNPLKTYEKLKPTLDDTVTYEGSGFLRYDREPDVADLVREKLQREEMPDGYVYELLEPTKALLLRYKALCRRKGQSADDSAVSESDGARAGRAGIPALLRKPDGLLPGKRHSVLQFSIC